RPRAGEVLAAVELARRQFVDDAESEHHPRARSADVLEQDLHLERKLVVAPDDDAEHRYRAFALAHRGSHLERALDAVPEHDDIRWPVDAVVRYLLAEPWHIL